MEKYIEEIKTVSGKYYRVYQVLEIGLLFLEERFE